MPQESFSYRNSQAAPNWGHAADSYRPVRARQEHHPPRGNYHDTSSERYRDRPNRRRPPNGNSDRRPFRPFRQKILPAERALLKHFDESGPGLVLGIAGDEGRARKFRAANDVSDSEEEDMAESDQDEAPYEPLEDSTITSTSHAPEDNGLTLKTQVDPEPPSKRRAIGDKTREDIAASLAPPKWSNPDPYTVLPPIDEEQRKRRDVVKMIRKHRMITDEEIRAENEVTANDDFISFGVDEKEDDEDDRETEPVQVAPVSPEMGRERPGHVDLDILEPLDSDPAFGNRKRTHDDRLKGYNQRYVRKKPVGNKPVGALLDEWIPSKGADPTPWIAVDHAYKNNAIGLHQEICDYYDYVQPKDFEKSVRQDLLDRLDDLVHRYDPDWSLHCFGSFAAGIYLPNADMDVVIMSWQFRRSGRNGIAQNYHKLQKIANYFAKHIAVADSVEVIASAKVPLIKFADAKTGINVDISFDNNTGLMAVETFELWKIQYPAVPVLVVLIKQFLKIRGLSEVVNGGLGGFSVTCMVTSLFQNLPRVQSGEIIPQANLGEMLIEFLDFYGNQLDLARVGLNMDPPGYFSKVVPVSYICVTALI